MLSIPEHLFNKHDNCGSWCRHGDQNSKNQTVLLKNQHLYTALKEIFEKYAKNSQKLCVSASRDSHVVNVNKKLQLSPGKFTESFTQQLDKTRKKRASKSLLLSTKRRRIGLNQKLEELRQKNEKCEGIQYKSNCGFVNEHISSNEVLDFRANLSNIDILSENSMIVYFDLETSGFHKNDEILQIAAQYENCKFNVYVTPTKGINPEAFRHTGLKNINGQLYLHHIKVMTTSLKNAMLAFQQFLSRPKITCLLVAHNASFDMSHLIRSILNCNMVEDFKVIGGFCDSLPLFKKHFTERTGEGVFKLESLARDFLKESNGAFHDASYDVHVLKLLASSYLHSEDIFSHAKSFGDSINHIMNLQQMNAALPFLKSLKTILKDGMLRKMAKEGLTYETIKKIR
ncbi:hypothetical protein PV326_000977 [Microctonus aethiopoides]|nr:hypothetical protein PV326_000977 [Microctonus aethiopoides]